MKNLNPIQITRLLLMALLMPFMTRAQSDRELLDNLFGQDSVDMNTLAGYPEPSRNAALEMAAHPESVTRLHDLRKKSNENFKNALGALSQYEQQRIYNLARYEGLIAELVKGGKKTTPQVKEILKNYPADAANDAIYCNEPSLLRRRRDVAEIAVQHQRAIRKGLQALPHSLDGVRVSIQTEHPAAGR